MAYKLNRAIKLSDLANALLFDWIGCDILIENVTSSSRTEKSSLTFSKTTLVNVKGVALVTCIDSDSNDVSSNGYILSNNPRLDFIKILTYLFNEIGFSTWRNPSIVHETAQLGRNVVIEDGCIIGKNTIIEHNVTIHSGTRIGQNTLIRSNASIGGDGFGFERLDSGIPIRFPHLGGVVIGNNVEVGSLTAIAKGTLGDTILKDNVKVDNLVHIAHNCIIHENVFITACAELSGGVVINRNSWIGPNASVLQKLEVGEGALIGIGAVLTKNVPDNVVFAGNPAKKLKEIL